MSDVPLKVVLIGRLNNRTSRDYDGEQAQAGFEQLSVGSTNVNEAGSKVSMTLLH